MTETNLSDFLAALPMPALMIDVEQRIAAANDAACALIGSNIVGRNFMTMIRQPALLEAIVAVLSTGAPQEVQYVANEGVQDATYRVTARLVPDLGAVLVCFVDMTDMEHASQMRRDFVANVSHELRTPLTALMGFIETLRGPARDDFAARDRFLKIMADEAGRMNRLVGDLLSLSRVEADERQRPATMVNLHEILKSVLHSIKQMADADRIALEAELGSEPVHLVGDADQLTQVFTNLIENAFKYGAAGGRVTVRVVSNDKDPALRRPSVRVHVIDYGAGIDPIHLPRLTERFYRADSHRSRALGGTGLGLAIVKHIINRHRGRLQVESDVGQGAEFTVILPIQSDGFAVEKNALS